MALLGTVFSGGLNLASEDRVQAAQSDYSVCVPSEEGTTVWLAHVSDSFWPREAFCSSNVN